MSFLMDKLDGLGHHSQGVHISPGRNCLLRKMRSLPWGNGEGPGCPSVAYPFWGGVQGEVEEPPPFRWGGGAFFGYHILSVCSPRAESPLKWASFES